MSSSNEGSSNNTAQEDQPLPPGWARQYSNSQKRYFFFHKDTKHTQWHFPTASEAKDPLKAKRRAEMFKEREQKRAHSSGGGPEAPDSKRPRTTAATSSSDNNNNNNNNTNTNNNNNNTNNSNKLAVKAKKKKDQDEDDFLELADQTSVAIIVPYRDLHAAQKRAAHLQQFVPHMHRFFGKLKQKGLISDYHVYIVEQSNDQRKFNRGKLLNIGFDMACKHHTKVDPTTGRRPQPHDVFIFHDVDLLPADDLGPWYAKFPTKPLHIARVWDRYSNNPKYFGGIVSFSKSDYKRINGYPNTFWGWGGEDDEMQKRLERLGIVFESPNAGTIRDLEEMTLTEKLDFLRQHKSWKCMVKWEALEEHESTWKTNGLSNLNYKLLQTQPAVADDPSKQKATKLTVDVLLNPNNHWANVKAGIDFTG